MTSHVLPRTSSLLTAAHIWLH